MRTTSLKIIVLLFLPLLGCQNKETADTIVKKSIEYYFPSGLDNKKISFDFRDKSYSVERYTDKYIYTRSFQDTLGFVSDKLINSSNFSRQIDEKSIEVTKEWANKYTSSVNSVLYFFQIPYVLSDVAAKKTLVAETDFNGKPYWAIKITFSEEKGGEDYDDQYIYWISKEEYSVDYFAYNYTVDGGGVRFREAINQRRIDNLLFQDYVNYEVEIGTPLMSIPELFLQGKLKELSKIINENIAVSQL